MRQKIKNTSPFAELYAFKMRKFFYDVFNDTAIKFLINLRLDRPVVPMERNLPNFVRID